jgi:rubredoxin
MKTKEDLSMEKINRVVIHVSHGVADVAYCPEDVEIEILDFDEANEHEDMGSHRESFTCPVCNQASSHFEWNAATVHDFGVEALRIHRIENPDVNFDFTCPRCFSNRTYKEIKEFTKMMSEKE